MLTEPVGVAASDLDIVRDFAGTGVPVHSRDASRTSGGHQQHMRDGPGMAGSTWRICTVVVADNQRRRVTPA